jgi:cardiolipin synthase A/B
MVVGLSKGRVALNSSMQTAHSNSSVPSGELSSRQTARALAEQSFSRASSAQLVEGNRVRLLINAAQNYPAWLAAIASARHHIHFESYIIHEDSAGLNFATALIAKAQQGVRVRLIYDWMGGLGKASRQFWNRLRDAGVEVRCYNPPHFDSPLGWLSRDHRKMLAVDGEVGFISGLCVGRMWVGELEKNIDPWRDTGIEVRGPALVDIERAFADVWAMMGSPIPDGELTQGTGGSAGGDVSMSRSCHRARNRRVVAPRPIDRRSGSDTAMVD